MAATHQSNILYFAEMDAQSAFDTAVNYRAIVEGFPLDMVLRHEHARMSNERVQAAYAALILAQDAYRDHLDARAG